MLIRFLLPKNLSHFLLSLELVRTQGEQIRAGIPDLQNALRSSWWSEGSVAFL